MEVKEKIAKFFFDVIPENIRRGLVKCQQFCGGKLVWIQMAGMGIAARRMNLMGYAQISSRIGGAIILLIGSIAFSFLG